MGRSKACKVSCFYYVEKRNGDRKPFLLLDVDIYKTYSHNPLLLYNPVDADVPERVTISSDDLVWYVVATKHPTKDNLLSVIRVSETGHEADVIIDFDLVGDVATE